MQNYTFGHNLIKSLKNNSFNLENEKMEDSYDNYFGLKSNTNFIPNSLKKSQEFKDSVLFNNKLCLILFFL